MFSVEPLYILDRWEEGFAVVEVSKGDDISFVTLNPGILPADAMPGDVLICTGEAWQVDKQATEKRRDALKKRFSKYN